MPVFPEIEVETAQWCNLRQALQWLRYETRPVDPVYEPLFAITDDLPSDSRKEKAALWAAMCAGRIRLFGRPGFGEFSADDEPDIAWFGRYGHSELVPIARLIEAGFDGLNFYRSRLGKITEWGDRCPSAGWEFSQLTIPTAELLSTFPAKGDPFTPAPPPIIAPPAREAASTPTLLPPQTILFLGEAIDRVETRTSADPWDAAIAVHRALCSGELVALSDREEVIPRGVWRSAAPMDLTERRRGHWEFDGLRYSNPTLTTESVDRWLAQAADNDQGSPPIQRQIAPAPEHRSAPSAQIASASELPVYVQFLLEMLGGLGGRDCIANRKKEDIEARIEASWRPELGERSQNKISAMATILRPPEAQRGGAKAQRQVAYATPGEGWNGSTPEALEG